MPRRSRASRPRRGRTDRARRSPAVPRGPSAFRSTRGSTGCRCRPAVRASRPRCRRPTRAWRPPTRRPTARWSARPAPAAWPDARSAPAGR
ncbi:hypothetical protein DLJ47_19925 [Micromonospora sp. S4605]|nr:hypothetical protein DLJ47_19925 [Micromonospora sp. S4605]